MSKPRFHKDLDPYLTASDHVRYQGWVCHYAMIDLKIDIFFLISFCSCSLQFLANFFSQKFIKFCFKLFFLVLYE